MHPCGVVLSDTSLLDRTPVEQSFEGLPLSQFDKDDVETAGMIKLDVLGCAWQSAWRNAHRVGPDRASRWISTHRPRRRAHVRMLRTARTPAASRSSPGSARARGQAAPRTIDD